MLWKAVKLASLTTASAAAIGGVVFGSDLISYVRSSAHSVSLAVKDDVPVEFQIRRVRDLLDDSVPEMQKNIRLMAEQEVDIASMKTDIAQCRQSLDDEKSRLQKLRDVLTSPLTSFTFGDLTYTRAQLTDELAQSFDEYKQAEAALEQKVQLLDTRQKALAEETVALERANTERAALQSQVDALEGRYHLVQATAGGTDLSIDSSKLSQAQQEISDLRRQLDVSEQVLATEAKFARPPQIDVVDEKQLLSQVDSQLSQPADSVPAPSPQLSDAGSVIGAK
jgi:chromosome segregation ATPase